MYSSFVLHQRKIIICFYVLILYNSESGASGGFRTTQIGPKPIWNETHLDKLKKDLLTNYDRYARPENHNNVTQVKIGITILYIEVNEQDSTIMVDSWYRMSWSDSKLKWDEHDYGGLAAIRIGDHEVWQPDISLYNSASGADQFARTGSRNVVVYSNGEVLWVPPVKFVALCDYNLQNWPFDTQHCHLKLGSWVYSDAELNITLASNHSSAEVETSTIIVSAWEVEAFSEIVTKKYVCCTETYSAVIIRLTLTRRSSPYYAIIVAPAIVTTFLILLQFWLPPNAGEKIILNGFTIVLLNMFLLYFNHQMIKVGSGTPLIVLFYSNSLYIVGFSTIVTITTFSLSKIRKRRPLPETLKKSLYHAGKWLFIEQYFKEKNPNNHDENIEEMKDHQLSEFENENDTNLMDRIQKEWNIFIIALDRIFFIIYCLVFIILASISF